MSRKLAELFKETINQKLHLEKKKDKSWSLKDIPEITIRTPSQNSFCFSLDCRSSPLSALFKSSSQGITKVCDAIIVLSHKDKTYIFIVEQKTQTKRDYEKQLANGKYFCDWVLALLKEHCKYNGEVVFIFLLCWEHGKKWLPKGESQHRNTPKGEPFGSDGLPQDVKNGLFYEVKNDGDINLLSFIE